MKRAVHARAFVVCRWCDPTHLNPPCAVCLLLLQFQFVYSVHEPPSMSNDTITINR